MLAWWHEGRSGDARLRTILVFDDEELIGVGPFFAQVGGLGLVEMRLLGAGFCHRIGPLAKEGHRERVAAALATALADMHPYPASVVFEGVDHAESWPALIANAWPSRRRPRIRTDVSMEGSIIELGASFDTWLERRPRQFRKEARRTARRLEEEHIGAHITSGDEAVDALLHLHEARWEKRGGSSIGDSAKAILVRASGELDAERLAIAILEGPEGPIAAELVLRAGDTAAFWGGGFDPAFSRHAPGTQAMLEALRALAGTGVEIADLGGGHLEYQRRLADNTQPVVWQTVFPRGFRYPLIRLRLAPEHVWLAVRGLARRLPRNQRARLKRMLRRDRA
jgi:CelD/BcsL family acetyltransferase involved in cellulose biosynthesis